MTGSATLIERPEDAVCADSDRKLRALLLIPQGKGKSSFIYSRRQAEMLRRAGVDVSVFFIESRTSPSVVAREFVRLRRTVRAFRPDVVHAQYGSMTGFLASMAADCPLVVTFRGSDLNPVPSVDRFRILLGHLASQIAAHRAATVICVSEALRGRLWWAAAKATVITGGVNLDLFRPIPQTEARERVGWHADSKVVLFNAGVHPRVKRVDLAEAAFKHARTVRPELELKVVRGDVEPDAMPFYYSAADCLLITSDYEGSPTVIKEALACNLPIVSVRVGDAEERLRNVSRCVLSDRDPAKVAGAILSVIRTDERSNGRQAVLDLSEYAEAVRIRRIYESIAQVTAGSCT